MSFSPPIRRLSNASSSQSRQEELINAYEAEEERIINILSRKLEQLREEKIELENVLEAESESHVNRLSRQLAQLRAQQQQCHTSHPSDSKTNGPGPNILPTPSSDQILEALRQENEDLRSRLVGTERDYMRIKRLNEIYREELIEHRTRLGLPLDNLIGLSDDPLSQPLHRRSTSSSSDASSPPTSVYHLSTHLNSSSAATSSHFINARLPAQNGVPIPRIPTQTSHQHRPVNSISSSFSPSSYSSSSVFESSTSDFSPSFISPQPASYVSAAATHQTTPPSSTSLNSNAPIHFGIIGGPTPRNLTYPSVPPPSLSSSPNVAYYIPSSGRESASSTSPTEPLSRRGSTANAGITAVARNGRRASFGSARGRRESVERGARVAETGVLIPRGRANSQSLQLAATQEAVDSDSGSS